MLIDKVLDKFNLKDERKYILEFEINIVFYLKTTLRREKYLAGNEFCGKWIWRVMNLADTLKLKHF